MTQTCRLRGNRDDLPAPAFGKSTCCRTPVRVQILGPPHKLNRRSRRLKFWRAIGIQSSNPLFAELRRSAQYICKSNILACIQAIVKSDV